MGGARTGQTEVGLQRLGIPRDGPAICPPVEAVTSFHQTTKREYRRTLFQDNGFRGEVELVNLDADLVASIEAPVGRL